MTTTVKNKRNRLRFIKAKATRLNGNEFDSAAAVKLKEVSKADKDAFLSMLDSNEYGLSSAQAKERRTNVGINEVEHEKAPKW